MTSSPSNARSLRPNDSVIVVVHDWPAIGRTTTLSLDKAIWADAEDETEAIRAHCERRYGEGTLKQSDDDGRYAYRRSFSAPKELCWLLKRVLFRSYA